LVVKLETVGCVESKYYQGWRISRASFKRETFIQIAWYRRSNGAAGVPVQNQDVSSRGTISYSPTTSPLSGVVFGEQTKIARVIESIFNTCTVEALS
jgi:hypothetical protein